MSLLHWEDFMVGGVACYGPRIITREEILAFAAEFDPQPMHADRSMDMAHRRYVLFASSPFTRIGFG